MWSDLHFQKDLSGCSVMNAGGGKVGRDRGQDSSDYTAVITQLQNGRASASTEETEWEVGQMRDSVRREGT